VSATLDHGTGAVASGSAARLRILVVDDSPSVQALLRGFLVREGHEVVVAEDGGSALTVFREAAPELILMDVMMPVLDGIEATRRLRAADTHRWVPVILLSALDTEDDVVRGLEAGADDYVVKPINLSVLRAKIRSLQRIAQLQRHLRDQALALEKFRDEQLAEQELARALIRNIARPEGLRDPRVTSEVIPAERFSGDVAAVARGPDGALYGLLGDATGHGLTASVSLIPALQVFFGMARKGLSLELLVREMNRGLCEVLPVGRYLAAAVVHVDARGDRAAVWNGGMPPVLMLDADGRERQSVSSRHVPLGILRDAEFSPECDVMSWDGPREIVLLSDGVVEAEDASGSAYGMPRVRRVLQQAPAGQRVAACMHEVAVHLAGAAARDDASMLAIRVG
jgi:CheY-like chemotaxis protein